MPPVAPNLQELLAKLPADSLAHRLASAFEGQESVADARRRLAEVFTDYLREADGHRADTPVAGNPGL